MVSLDPLVLKCLLQFKIIHLRVAQVGNVDIRSLDFRPLLLNFQSQLLACLMVLTFLSCDLILERGCLPFKLKVVVRSNQLTCHSENFKSFVLLNNILVFNLQNVFVQSIDIRKLDLRFFDEKVS